MDTYIKMCDCEEVQGLWEPKDGDRIKPYARFGEKRWLRETLETWGHSHNPWGWSRETKSAYLYLPRQEDIQEMCGQSAYEFLYACAKTASEMVTAGEYFGETTLEEIGIRWFMIRVHNKHWTKEGWV